MQAPELERPDNHSPSREYAISGHLLGTEWEFPRLGKGTIDTVKHVGTLRTGEQTYHPEVELKLGELFSVEEFLKRIDPDQIGDIEPVNDAAKAVVEHITQ